MKIENFKIALLDEGVTQEEWDREDHAMIQELIESTHYMYYAIQSINWTSTKNGFNFWNRLCLIYGASDITEERIKSWRNKA